MEVPAGQDGIQRLLQAEQEAQSVVAKARKGEIEPALNKTTIIGIAILFILSAGGVQMA